MVEQEFNAGAKADIRTRLENLERSKQQYPFTLSEEDALTVFSDRWGCKTIDALLLHPFAFYDMLCDDIGQRTFLPEAGFLIYRAPNDSVENDVAMFADKETCNAHIVKMQERKAGLPVSQRGIVDYNIHGFELALSVFEYVEGEHNARVQPRGVVDFGFDNFMREVTEGQHKFQFD